MVNKKSSPRNRPVTATKHSVTFRGEDHRANFLDKKTNSTHTWKGKARPQKNSQAHSGTGSVKTYKEEQVRLLKARRPSPGKAEMRVLWKASLGQTNTGGKNPEHRRNRGIPKRN